MLSLFKKSKHVFDKTEPLLLLAKQYENDPLELIYIINYATKLYISKRSKELFYNNDIKRENLPDIEVLPREINRYDLLMTGKKNVSNTINLQSSAIIPWVWNKSRLIDCIKYIGTEENPWQLDDSNHRVKFLFPMCYTVVYGGNHSLTTGILKGSNVEFKEESYYDLSHVYKEIRYKKGFFYTPNGKFKLSDNERITGILFEIGRMILNSGFTYDDYITKYQNKYDPKSSKTFEKFALLELESSKLIDEIVCYKI